MINLNSNNSNISSQSQHCIQASQTIFYTNQTCVLSRQAFQIPTINSQPSFISINDYVFFKIVCYLDFTSIVNLIKSISYSKYLKIFISHDQMYKHLYSTCFFENEIMMQRHKPQNISYRDYFVEHFKRLQRYKNILTNLTDPIFKIQLDCDTKYFQENDAHSFFQGDSLIPITNNSGIQTNINFTLEKKHQNIPRDLLILYQTLIGTSKIFSLNKIPFQEQNYIQIPSDIKNEDSQKLFITFNDRIFGFLSRFNALHLASTTPLKKELYMDIHNLLGFGNQTIFSFKQSADQNDNIYKIYISHPNLDSFIDSLQSNNWDPKADFEESVDTLISPDSDTSNFGIRIRASAKYCFFQSIVDKEKFYYVYCIRISANAIPKMKKYKLISMNLIVISNHSRTKIKSIRCSRLIEHFPEMYDGAKDFVCFNCCRIKERQGKIKGSLQFIDTQTGELVKVQINPFFLKPKGTKVVLYNDLTQEVKILYQ